MSRSPWASTKSLVGLFATSALGISRCAAPARAGSARGRHSTPSTTAPKPGSKGAPDTGAVVLGPWIGCSSQEGAARVRALQVLLAGAGCPPGPIDGLYGPLTEQAVVGHPGPALPHAVHRQRARTTLPTNARIHSSSSPFAVIGRLVGMAAVLLLATMAFSGRRRGRRSAPGDARTPVEPKGLIEAPKTDGLEIAEDAQGPNAGREADHTPVSGEADLTFRRVLALEEAGHLTEAVAAYRRADEFGHATAPSNLGVLLEQHGGRGGAETFYLRAHQRGNADLAFNLALPLAEQDNQMGALEAYKRADLPGHRTAAANLGCAGRRTRRAGGRRVVLPASGRPR